MSDDSSVETVSVEMRRELARELVDILEHEVDDTATMHSTEQVMQESARTIRRQLSKTDAE